MKTETNKILLEIKTSVCDKLENNCFWYKLENKLPEELQDYKIKLKSTRFYLREGYKITKGK